MPTATRRLGLLTSRQLRLMTDSAVVLRSTKSQDSSGGEVDVVTQTGPFRCRLTTRRVTPIERVEGGRIEAVTLYTAYLPHGTDVLPADQMIVTEADTGRSQTFEISDHTDFSTDGASMAVSLRLIH
jgi:hypothetical protein